MTRSETVSGGAKGLVSRAGSAARRWARVRWGDGGLVLLYHRIADPAEDPWRLSVSPAHFDEHLEVLKRRAPLFQVRDLSAALRSGTIPRRFLLVTFDDGYVDNLTRGKPLLERHGVPATVFVSSGWLDRGIPYWWDELQQLVFEASPLPDVLRIDLPEGPWEYVAGPNPDLRETASPPGRGWRASRDAPPTKRHAAYVAVHAALSARDPSICESGMRQLRSQLAPAIGGSGDDFGRPLTTEELGRLASGGLVEIGAHGVTHARLSKLSAADQRREIAESRRRLEETSPAPVTSFAYPFGGTRDYTDETTAIVVEEGFSAACATSSGLVRAGADLWRLPRFHVVDSDGEQFQRRIWQWLAA